MGQTHLLAESRLLVVAEAAEEEVTLYEQG
jgi:hypothetical protein